MENAISKSIEKSLNQTATLWLDGDDYFELPPAHNIICAIVVDARTSSMSTNTSVQSDGY